MVSLRNGSWAPGTHGAAHLSHTVTKDSGTWAFSPALRPAPAPASTFCPAVPRGATPSTTRPRARALLALAALTTRPLRPGARRAPEAWLCRACTYLAAPPPGSGPARTLAHRGLLGSSAPDRRLPPGRSQGRGRCAHTGHARGARGGGNSAGSEPSCPGRRGRGQAAPAYMIFTRSFVIFAKTHMIDMSSFLIKFQNFVT